MIREAKKILLFYVTNLATETVRILLNFITKPLAAQLPNFDDAALFLFR